MAFQIKKTRGSIPFGHAHHSGDSSNFESYVLNYEPIAKQLQSFIC